MICSDACGFGACVTVCCFLWAGMRLAAYWFGVFWLVLGGFPLFWMVPSGFACFAAVLGCFAICCFCFDFCDFVLNFAVLLVFVFLTVTCGWAFCWGVCMCFLVVLL